MGLAPEADSPAAAGAGAAASPAAAEAGAAASPAAAAAPVSLPSLERKPEKKVATAAAAAPGSLPAPERKHEKKLAGETPLVKSSLFAPTPLQEVKFSAEQREEILQNLALERIQFWTRIVLNNLESPSAKKNLETIRSISPSDLAKKIEIYDDLCKKLAADPKSNHKKIKGAQISLKEALESLSDSLVMYQEHLQRLKHSRALRS
jgi:hypothetical protein